MADMKSKVKFAFDADSGVTLRDAADGAETANAAESGVTIPSLNGAYWDDNDVAHESLTVVVVVSDIDVSDADETYVIAVETDSSNAFGSAVEVGSLTVPGAVGSYAINLDADTIKALDPTAQWIRVSLTVGGTTPSITYSAWLSHSLH